MGMIKKGCGFITYELDTQKNLMNPGCFTQKR